jgi:hypothetical protein
LRFGERVDFLAMAKWISWAGVGAMIGGLVAIALTPPFAVAYFKAYPGSDVPPFWIEPIKPILGSLLTFGPPTVVYLTYGRVYNIVYLLLLAGVFGLHAYHQGSRSRLEKWAFYLQVAALITIFIGVVGDYWASSVDLFLVGWLGLLVLSIGTTIYGIALLRSNVLPRWCAWLFVAGVPALFIFQLLIWQVPSGLTFPFAVLWLIVGYMMASNMGIQRAQTSTPKLMLIHPEGTS